MKLPDRLEAYDMQESPDGWALEVKDVWRWAKEVLVFSEQDPALARICLQALVQHLTVPN